MSNDETRLRQPVMRRATEPGCAGWTPITRAPAAPAIVRPVDEPAAADSADVTPPLPAKETPSR